MQLKDVRDAYESLSGKASDIVRQLALAGVGLIWVFKTEAGTSLSLDPKLLNAAVWIFVTLLLDFLQYLFGTSIWFLYFRHREKEGTTQSQVFEAPEQLNWPTWTFFYLKSVTMFVAYAVYIIPFLKSKLTT